jgi:hypothetical protein
MVEDAEDGNQGSRRKILGMKQNNAGRKAGVGEGLKRERVYTSE